MLTILKTTILHCFALVAMLLPAMNALSQDHLRPLDEKKIYKATYYFTSTAQLDVCDYNGRKTSGSELLYDDFKFTIVNKTDKEYVIEVLDFNNNDTYQEQFVQKVSVQKNSEGEIISSTTTDIFFALPFATFDQKTELKHERVSFSIGIPLLPVKMRFGGGTGANRRYFQFDGGINLGASFGARFRVNRDNSAAIILHTGFTISSIELDSSSTGGLLNAETNIASFSPHFGVILEIKKIQVGAYVGLDFLSGEPNARWLYRNQPWLGIGIGYSLFSIGEPSKNNTSTPNK